MPFTDITRTNWMSRLPDGMHPYIHLMRLDRPIGWWLLLLPAWWGITLGATQLTGWVIVSLILFWIGAIVMRAAGCIVNDMWDIELDKVVGRTAQRPLASGVISMFDATILLILLVMLGLAILILMPPMTIVLGVLSIPFIIAYPYMKRITWWPQAFLGLTFNFGALMGFAAATGTLSGAALLLYIAGIFWTLAYDTIYAHQDIEDDMRVGIKSTARLFGENSRMYVFAFYGIALVWLLLAMAAAGVSWFIYLLILPAIVYTIIRLQRWDPNDQTSSLTMFKANRNIGLLVFAALFISLFI